MITSLLWNLIGTKPLIVRNIESDHVIINSGFETLYGARVISYGEKPKTFSEETIKRVAGLSSSGLILFIAIARFKEKREGYRTTEVYYFSFNKDLMNVLKNALEERFILMSGEEVANVLLKLMMAESTLEYMPEEKKLINKDRFISGEGIVRDEFFAIVHEIDPDEYRVYAGINYEGYENAIDWERMLSTPFEGVVWITLDFTDQGILIRRKKTRAGEFGKVFKEMEEKQKEGTQKYVGISCVFITKDKRADEYVVNFLGSLGFTALELKNTKDLHIRSTPIIVRDMDFTYLTDITLASRYTLTDYEKTYVPERIDISGVSRRGSFVAYSLFEENPAPHAVVFAKTGSGKSFGLQNIVCQILGLDVAKLYEGLPQGIRNVRIRYIDKGFSAEGLFLLMKERGIPTGVFSSELEKFTFNVCEVEDELDLEFSLQTVNACLFALGQEPLKGLETNIYTKALRYFQKNKKEVSYANFHLKVLSSIDSLREVYEELIRKGYSPNEIIGNVVEKEEGYDFLLQPTLGDIIRYLGGEEENLSATEDYRQAVKSLKTKLEVLNSYPQISLPSRVNLSMHDLIYIDVEILSKSVFFVPLVLGILKKLIKYDFYYKPQGVRSFFIIDEAHNFFRNEFFSQALIVLVKEARKYGVSVWFSTQDFEDIPFSVISNAHTRMLIAPIEDADRKVFLDSLQRTLQTKSNLEEEDLGYVYMRTPSRTFTVWYSKGVFSLVLPVDHAKLIVFDSRRFVIETPDGKKILKTPARMGVEL